MTYFWLSPTNDAISSGSQLMESSCSASFSVKLKLVLLKAIKLSGSKYKEPDNTYGYGIPDFGVAHKILIKMGY